MEKISWKALEYTKTEKSNDWYWAVIIIALSIVVISFMSNDGLFSIFIIIAVATLIMFSLKEPQLMNISIDERGIIIDKDMYPFATLESFWVEIADEHNGKIILKSKKVLMSLIIIPIEEYHHMDIRDLLLNFLPEVEMHEPLFQKIMERLGF